MHFFIIFQEVEPAGMLSFRISPVKERENGQVFAITLKNPAEPGVCSTSCWFLRDYFLVVAVSERSSFFGAG